MKKLTGQLSGIIQRGLVGAAFMLLACPTSVLFGQAVRITSPADGAVVYSGQMLTVVVSADSSAFRSVGILVDGTLGGSPEQISPPYQFLIPIPPKTPSGHYLIAGTGTRRSGGDPVFSAPVEIDVERPDTPQQLKSDGETLNFQNVGSKLPLGVMGTFADGSRVRLTQSTYIAYSSESPGVATVDDRGIVTAVAPGEANITIKYGQFPASAISIQVFAYVPDPVTVAPVASSVYPSQTQEFCATLAIDPNLDQSVTWSINPQLGSIDDTGKYSAPPSVSRRQSITVTATSVADPKRSASTKLWIIPRDSK